jgi:hypothetical protein
VPHCAVQLEKARLDAETSLKRVEAEAALARAAAAQAEASFKAERAGLVTSLDAQKFEVSSSSSNVNRIIRQYMRREQLQ